VKPAATRRKPTAITTKTATEEVTAVASILLRTLNGGAYPEWSFAGDESDPHNNDDVDVLHVLAAADDDRGGQRRFFFSLAVFLLAPAIEAVCSRPLPASIRCLSVRRAAGAPTTLSTKTTTTAPAVCAMFGIRVITLDF
jgi:hypothetical protein